MYKLMLFEDFSKKDYIPFVYYTIEEFDGNNFKIIEKDKDYDEILKEFENIVPSYSELSSYDKPTYQLVKYKDYYKFVYELSDDESLDEYPLEDYYDDSFYYKKVDNDESIIMDTIVFDSENTINDKLKIKINDIKRDVDITINNKYKEYIHYSETGGFLKESTYLIFLIDSTGNFVKFNKNDIKYSVDVSSYDGDVFNKNGVISNKSQISRNVKFDDETLSVFQLRISNHSQNIERLNNFIESSLSVVICLENETEKSFEHEDDYNEEIVYDKKDYFSSINLDSDNQEYVKDICSDVYHILNKQGKYFNQYHK